MYDIQKNGTEPVCRVGIRTEWGCKLRAAVTHTHYHV